MWQDDWNDEDAEAALFWFRDHVHTIREDDPEDPLVTHRHDLSWGSF